MVGLDTGFFFHLRKGTPRALEVWERVVRGEGACISAVTVYELLKAGYRMGSLKVSSFVEDLAGVLEVVPVDYQVAHRAAGLAHGLGIPGLDALILASLLQAGSREIYTSDSHLEAFKGEGVEVVNLGPVEL